MSKKFVVFASCLMILVLLAVFSSFNNHVLAPVDNNVLKSVSPTGKPTEGISLDYSGVTYKVLYLQVKDTGKITLSPNFEKKQTSNELKTEKQCDYLLSGGFYDKDDTPIGLLISNGYEQSFYQTNSLFNGIFGVTYAEKPFLGSNYPRGSTRLAVQAGPILILDSKLQALSIKNDEPNRRNFVALVDDGSLVFASVFDKTSEYNGPELADMPKIVDRLSEKLNMDFISAMNLDGGSASAFLTPSGGVEEISYIGSYFCIKQ